MTPITGTLNNKQVYTPLKQKKTDNYVQTIQKMKKETTASALYPHHVRQSVKLTNMHNPT